MPRIISDDLAASEVFLPAARRIRIATSTARLDSLSLRTDKAWTRLADLIHLVAAGTTVPTRLAVFLTVTLGARIRGRQRIHVVDFTTWLREESSRER